MWVKMNGMTMVQPGSRVGGDGMDIEEMKVEAQKIDSIKAPSINHRIAPKCVAYEPVSGTVKSLEKETSSSTSLLAACFRSTKNDEHVKVLVENVGDDDQSQVRLVEGRDYGEVSIESMRQKVKETGLELERQVNINSELKKLVIASIGQELHHKMDKLVRERAQLSQEVENCSEKIMKDCELMDQLFIQADMWRTKFSACQLYINQLRDEKQKWLNTLLEHRLAMTELLGESNRIKRNLFCMASSLLNISPTDIVNMNVLELSEQLGGLHKNNSMQTSENNLNVSCTEAEIFSHQLLDQFEFSISDDKDLKANVRKFSRFHPSASFENLTLDCCNKCKGGIIYV